MSFENPNNLEKKESSRNIVVKKITNKISEELMNLLNGRSPIKYMETSVGDVFEAYLPETSDIRIEFDKLHDEGGEIYYNGKKIANHDGDKLKVEKSLISEIIENYLNQK